MIFSLNKNKEKVYKDFSKHFFITHMDSQVVLEVSDDSNVGSRIGQCKWFNDKLGYGFITVQAGEDKGKDIFVHHSGIKPLNSNYKTLKKGEYINFNIIDGDNGLQAVNVTGICGGSLMCDVLPSIKLPMPLPMQVDQQGFTMVMPRVHAHAHAHGQAHRGPRTYRQGPRSTTAPMQT